MPKQSVGGKGVVSGDAVAERRPVCGVSVAVLHPGEEPVPLTTAAGRALGGNKDNQAIIWDEIVTVPIVFLLVPLTGWTIAVAGFLLHRLMDISKPPPARQLERLPEGLGVMADDVIASVYACAALAGLAWVDHTAGGGFLAARGG